MISWDLVLCSFANSYQCFAGRYGLCLQPWTWRPQFPPKLFIQQTTQHHLPEDLSVLRKLYRAVMEVKTGESLICAKPTCHDTEQISCNFLVTIKIWKKCV
jgi:hypothetical protein